MKILILLRFWEKNDFKGPINWRQSQKFALFAGAADLFGAMVQKPISLLVEEKFDLNVVNLSIGGLVLNYLQMIGVILLK